MGLVSLLNDVKYVFICLLSIWRALCLWNACWVFLLVLKLSLFFFCLEFHIHYKFEPFLGQRHCKYLSLVSDLPCTLLTIYFDEQMLYILIKSNLSNSYLMVRFFISHIRNICVSQSHKYSFLCFLLDDLDFQFSHFAMIHSLWTNLCLQCKVGKNLCFPCINWTN